MEEKLQEREATREGRQGGGEGGGRGWKFTAELLDCPNLSMSCDEIISPKPTKI